MTTFPAEGISSDKIRGFTKSIPAFIARADINTSGTNICPDLKRTPTTLIPGISPWLIISTGSLPAEIAC